MESQLGFIYTPDLLVVTGSRLYGTQRYDAQGNCVSDVDRRGFVLPPFEYLASFQNFDEGELAGDHKIWSMRRFFDMLLNGNAQALECLFAPPSHVEIATDIGRQVLDRRWWFVSKLFYRSITGFSYSEFRKVRGVKLVVPEREKTEDDVVQAYLNVFRHHPKDLKDQIIELMFSMHEKQEVPCRTQVGEKRKAEYDLYGYCATCAHHAIRVLYQCEELLLHGHMTFPRPESVLLSQIKRGEPSYEEVEALYEDARSRADAAYEKSTLPERADRAKLHQFYRSLATEVIGEHYV